MDLAPRAGVRAIDLRTESQFETPAAAAPILEQTAQSLRSDQGDWRVGKAQHGARGIF